MSSEKGNFSYNITVFLMVFFCIVSTFFVVAAVVAMDYMEKNPISNYDPMLQRDSSVINKSEIVEVKTLEEDTFLNNAMTTPVRTNFLMIGIDKRANLTDTIMVGSYISTRDQINLISIPRDTYVSLDAEQMSVIEANGIYAPSYMKINSLHAYGGDKGVELIKQEVEEILGIKIDYCVKIDLNAFKQLVDAVGGVDFEVPEGGLHYSDPMQDLYIDLQGGMQHLDGEHAEQLVRFRSGYARADLQRVEVQQAFVREFIKQSLNKETVMENLGSIISTLVSNVETDFGIEDIPKYLKCIRRINCDNMNTTTLPGYPQMISGGSYYIHDAVETGTLVDDFFYGDTAAVEETTEITSENDVEETTVQ
ncbi:MAG: LCP family protein [Firmicutes bacterium]|nr:LCP family protein [Bacillota bacterium]